jgi:hypothetical protein
MANRATGFIYFIESKYGIKIGRTNKLRNRMKFFGVKLPFEWELKAALEVTDCHAAESWYHQIHSSRRINGEWFRGPIEELFIKPDHSKVRWRILDVPKNLELINEPPAWTEAQPGIWREYMGHSLGYYSKWKGSRETWLGTVKGVLSCRKVMRWFVEVPMGDTETSCSASIGMFWLDWREAELAMRSILEYRSTPPLSQLLREFATEGAVQKFSTPWSISREYPDGYSIFRLNHGSTWIKLEIGDDWVRFHNECSDAGGFAAESSWSGLIGIHETREDARRSAILAMAKNEEKNVRLDDKCFPVGSREGVWLDGLRVQGLYTERPRRHQPFRRQLLPAEQVNLMIAKTWISL